MDENNTISIKNLDTTGNKKDYPETYDFENVECYIEKLDPKVAVMFGDENAFNTFLCSINKILDIRKGAIGIDKNGNQYRVGGFVKYENNEIPDHMEITMYQKNADNN